jgi:hypothetical protein
MSEKPIIFSGPMVRAILEGRKTQTRRVISVTNDPGSWEPATAEEWMAPTDNRPALGGHPVAMFRGSNGRLFGFNPPYKVGDLLWVRESFYVQGHLWQHGSGNIQPIHYAADISDRQQVEDYTLKPSIHMPRWASRITLEVTAVRAERLQQISVKDAKTEGVTHWKCGHPDCLGPSGESGLHYGPVGAFMELWDSINGKRPGCAWDDNPWVWVYEFKRT